MLRRLLIHNLLLFENVSIELQPGFTVITGESGAGKTAIIEALRLVMGQRADTSKIRKGTNLCHIEAHFELSPESPVFSLCNEGGFSLSPEDPFIIKREVLLEGKTRAFLNEKVITLSFLSQLACNLIDFVGQHQSLDLKQMDYQEKLVDTFGNIDTKPFALLFFEEKKVSALLKETEEAIDIEEKRVSATQYELAEIQRVAPYENEPTILHEKHRDLTQRQTQASLLQTTIASVEELLTHLRSIQQIADTLQKHDSSLSTDPFKESHLLISSYLFELERKQDLIDIDPRELEQVEARMQELYHLQKKYGNDLYRAMQTRLHQTDVLTDKHNQAEILRKELARIQERLNEMAQTLRSQRIACAAELSARLSSELQTLNMDESVCVIECSAKTRSQTGDDQITFFLKANKGERFVSLKEGCSGGELSRILFAIKKIFAKRQSISLAVFDEIDANIGGKTSKLIGESLHAMGQEHQILCITHFPQVTLQADGHLCVHKQEQEGRILSSVHLLDRQGRDIERKRMVGETPLIGSGAS